MIQGNRFKQRISASSFEYGNPCQKAPANQYRISSSKLVHTNQGVYGNNSNKTKL